MYEDGVMKVINTLMREIAVLKDKVSALEEENKELKQKLKSTQTRPWFKNILRLFKLPTSLVGFLRLA